MDAIRRGLRIKESSDDDRRSSSRVPATNQPVILTQSSSSGLEPETTIKNKLVSAWNNVKYGKNVWATQEMFKQRFSVHSPVWLLGHAYHRKLISSAEHVTGSPPGNTVRTFSETDSGIAEFEADFSSRIWFTYRRDIPELGPRGLTSDCGWGCMIRSGQMMLAQALILHWLGRDWRLSTGSCLDLDPTERWQAERLYRAVIQLFSDTRDSRAAPLSLNNIVDRGHSAGRVAGDWYGPHTVAHLLAGCVRSCERGDGQGLLDNVSVYVAQDCTVYRGDVEDICRDTVKNTISDTDDFSLIDVPRNNTKDVDIDGETWCMETPTPVTEPSSSSWRSVIILVPVRLGSEVFNPIYNSCIKNLLTLDCCVGIMGGKPKHSLYFIGFQDDDLIHLDPHRLQDRVDTLRPDFNTSSYHCHNPRKINIKKLDPSCCIGFYLRSYDDWVSWCETITDIVTPPQISGIRAEYPMFVVSPGHCSDTTGRSGLQDWVSLTPASDSIVSSQSLPSNMEQETEEFVFL